MCKIMLIAGLKPKNKKNNWDFISTMGELMTPGNDDGIGYTAVDTKGDIFGERWLFNQESFSLPRPDRFTLPRKIDKTRTSAFKEMLSEFIDLEDEVELGPIERYGSFGNLHPEITAITLHTRAASNTINYANVHPFVDVEKSISVIHNGIIRNHVKADEIRSTCDSERILNKYIDHEIYKTPADMQNLIDDLKGWFACGILSKTEDGLRVMDIFKTNASLSAAFVKELDAVVFATQLDDIKRACRRLKFTIQSKADKVKEDTLLRLDAVTGKKILTLKYTDTTNRYVQPPYNHYGAHNNWGRDTDDSYWSQRAREKEEEEKKKAELAKTTALTLVPDEIEEDRPTEAQTQETAELVRSGLVTDEEIKEREKERKIQAIIGRNFTREVAVAYVEKRDAMDELIKQGWEEDEAKEFVEKQALTKLVNKQTTVDAVASEVKTAKDIVMKNVSDKLMETMAAMDDFYWIQESGIWMKRLNGKH